MLILENGSVLTEKGKKMADWIVTITDGFPHIRDMKPLVRCKDCKWFGDLGCAIRIVDDSDKPTENDYCSFAERRSE